MALIHKNITLNGATQVTSSAGRKGIEQIIFQNPNGNGTIYIGNANMSSSLSSSSYGISVAGGAQSPAIGPFSGHAPLNTDELYVAGTDTQTVHALLITH